MTFLVGFLGVILIISALWDSFETIVLPRRVTRDIGLARLFYRATWKLWSALLRPMREGSRRETWLGIYGSLSLILLLAVWATLLIIGFAALQWALGSQVMDASQPGPPGTGGRAGFVTDLYMSGTTFFTLGYGDVTPIATWPRAISVVEAGLGFAFLALIIGYLPPLTQA